MYMYTHIMMYPFADIATHDSIDEGLPKVKSMFWAIDDGMFALFGVVSGWSSVSCA